METISLQGKTNFFEKRVGEYSKSGIGVDRANQIFALNTSFWPPLYFIPHHLPACLHIFVPVGTQTFPHLLYPEALQGNNYTECDKCH